MLLTLAGILSGLKGRKYEDSVIARVHFIAGRQTEPKGSPKPGLEIKKEHEKSMQVVCRAVQEKECGMMEVLLFLHHAPVETANRSDEKVCQPHLTEHSAWQCFSAADIEAFVKAAGDTNTIHTGPDAVVPGLLLLQEILRQRPARDINLRFFQAARAEEELFWLQETPQMVTIYSKNKKIAQAVIRGDLENENGRN